MASRSLSNALRLGGRECQVVSRCSASQYRSFTTSPRSQRQNVVPVLSEEASSPELTAVLSTVRRTVFLPASISKAHQNFIYSKKAARTLKQDPVTVEVGGETFNLEALDRTKDLPNGWQTLTRAMNLFQTKTDWDNLPRLLEGFTNAKRDILKDGWRFEKVVRIAGKAGRMDVIVECLRRAEKTGFKLLTPQHVAWVTFWIQYEAAENGFSAAATKKALNLAEQVTKAIGEEENLEFRMSKDVLANTSTVAVLAGLSARKAQLEDTDIGGKAQMYASRLLDVTEGLSFKQLQEAREDFLGYLSSVVFAFKTAAVALPRLESLSARAADASKDLEEAYQGVSDGKHGSGLNKRCYEKLAKVEL